MFIPVSLFFSNKNPEKALQILQKNQSLTANGLIIETRIFFALQDWERAQRLYNERITQNPKSAFAHVGLGISYAEQNYLGKAVLQFQKAKI